MKRILMIAAVVVLVFCAAIELGSPYWTRHQVTNAAHAAASAGANTLATTKDSKTAEAAAVNAASRNGATLEAFTQQPNGTVKVTVSKQAKSYLMRHWSATRNWYEIKASATATAG